MKHIAKRLRSQAASLRAIADQLDREANAVDEKGPATQNETGDPPEGGGGNADDGPG